MSNLPAETALKDLVRLAHHRWIMERDYLELTQELGLGHFEGRSWRGFHHHATLCIAADGHWWPRGAVCFLGAHGQAGVGGRGLVRGLPTAGQPGGASQSGNFLLRQDTENVFFRGQSWGQARSTCSRPARAKRRVPTNTD
jgi:hypothetical protein